DHFKNYEALVTAFSRFISNIPFYGVAILCLDHPVVASLACQTIDRRILTYGFSPQADIWSEDYRLEKKGGHFSVRFSDKCIARYAESLASTAQQAAWSDFFLPMIGRHNIQNALSIVALALELKISPTTLRLAFQSFMGVGRRFTILAEANGIRIVDDYGHHPVEIRATLEAARIVTPGRLWAVIQPHRYTRLKNLFSEFVGILGLADQTFLTPLYTAGEPPLPGISHQALYETGKERSLAVSLTESPEELCTVLLPQLREGDTIIFLGAGTISRWAHLFADAFSSCHKEVA
ncbi:MAG: UDP-N-acetylmuramate--L-alanine ligase, partial [Holosporales bacterium]|nr:UDP-N-acetylmuramate--L-alanine ligase [Holosporales bacterium]